MVRNRGSGIPRMSINAGRDSIYASYLQRLTRVVETLILVLKHATLTHFRAPWLLVARALICISYVRVHASIKRQYTGLG
jgi:hypothetical protein